MTCTEIAYQPNWGNATTQHRTHILVFSYTRICRHGPLNAAVFLFIRILGGLKSHWHPNRSNVSEKSCLFLFFTAGYMIQRMIDRKQTWQPYVFLYSQYALFLWRAEVTIWRICHYRFPTHAPFLKQQITKYFVFRTVHWGKLIVHARTNKCTLMKMFSCIYFVFYS
jgi:hypothetical protein